MKTYMVSYDLIGPARDYTKVIAHLKTYSWARPLESVWIIRTNLSAGELLTAVRKHVDANDKVLVIGIAPSPNWSTIKVNREVTDWMHRNL